MALGIAHLTRLVEQLQTQVGETLCLLQKIDDRTAEMPSRSDLDQAVRQLQQAIADALPTAQDVIDLRNDMAAVAKIDPAQKGS